MAVRQPPSNPLAEESVLGALLANSARAYPLCAGLDPSHFADDTHREIYRAIQRRCELGRRVDGPVLWSALEHTGLLNDLGGVAYLTHLLAVNVGFIVIPEYVAAIRDCAARRALIVAAEGITERAYRTELDDSDAAATAAWGMAQIEAATIGVGGARPVDIGQTVDAVLAQSEAAQRGDQSAMGLLTGIPSLDEKWGGLYPECLDFIGARRGEGKTALMRQIARNVAFRLIGTKDRVLVFTLDMSAKQLMLMDVSSVSGISADDIRGGRYDLDGGSDDAYRIIQAGAFMKSLPIDYFEKATLGDAIGKIRERRPVLTLADHRDKFMRDEGWENKNETAWYQHVTAALKEAAKAVHAPIVLLQQLAMEADKRDDPRPRLGDIRYGGVNDADTVVLLHRPARHMGECPPQKPNEDGPTYANRASLFHAKRADLENVSELIMAKKRFGREDTVRLQWNGPTTSYRDWQVAADEVPANDLWSE
jgi:replicative DNA helicase